MHGQFVWYELSTPDTDAAQKFYHTLAGWTSQPFDADYTLLSSNGVPVAGIFRLTDEMRTQGIPPNWMPYVEARNVSETARLATSLGARVLHGPVTIPNVGEIAVIQDPQGAMFGLYKSTSGAQGWDGQAVLGHFSWNELMTTDHAKAFEFYRRLFGWEKVSEMDMGNGDMYWLFGRGSAMYGGMFTRPAEMAQMHPFWLCYIHVKDVHQSVRIATGAGASVHRPPIEIPGGMIAILGDPQGAGIAVHHLSAATVAPTSSGNGNRPSSGTAEEKVVPKKSQSAAKSDARNAAKPALKKVASGSAGKKSGTKKSAAKKSTAKKSAAKKSTAKKSTRKQSTARKSGAKKSASKASISTRRGTKQSASRKSAAKKRGAHASRTKAKKKK